MLRALPNQIQNVTYLYSKPNKTRRSSKQRKQRGTKEFIQKDQILHFDLFLLPSLSAVRIRACSALSCMPQSMTGDELLKRTMDAPARKHHSFLCLCADIPGFSSSPIRILSSALKVTGSTHLLHVRLNKKRECLLCNQITLYKHIAYYQQ